MSTATLISVARSNGAAGRNQRKRHVFVCNRGPLVPELSGRYSGALGSAQGEPAVETVGHFNASHGAEAFGFKGLSHVYWNLEAPRLYEEALTRREAVLAKGGALVAETGAHTGRSPKDKFVVRDEQTEANVWWDNNGAISRQQFDALLADFLKHAEGKELFAQDLHGGADPQFRVRTRVFTEYAWHSLFIRNLLIRPEARELAGFTPELTIVDLPSFKA